MNKERSESFSGSEESVRLSMIELKLDHLISKFGPNPEDEFEDDSIGRLHRMLELEAELKRILKSKMEEKRGVESESR